VPGSGGGDFNDPVRDQISSAYNSLFGRYGEQGGVEGYVSTWVYGNGPALYGTITGMVQNGGTTSGEWASVQNIGRHTGLASGPCPTEPPPPPPPPSIRPYVKINGSWTKSKNVYIKDAGSWKLCRSAYIKDGGVWEPFLEN
jgi:hypothetical protein